ncbi:hypothetical protein C0991_002212, partial [Blastosporella zonata]
CNSGSFLLPFTSEPIENPTFDLGKAIKDAINALDEQLEDDAHLTSTALDQDVMHFWCSASDLSLHVPPILPLVETISINPVNNTAINPLKCSASMAIPGHIEMLTGPNTCAHAKHAKKQALKVEAEGLGYHAPQNKIIETHVQEASTVNTELNIHLLPLDSSGFIGKSKRPGEGVYFESLQDLLDDSYKLIE